MNIFELICALLPTKSNYRLVISLEIHLHVLKQKDNKYPHSGGGKRHIPFSIIYRPQYNHHFHSYQMLFNQVY